MKGVKTAIFVLLMIILSSTALAANFTTDNYLQSNSVNAVDIYDTANDSIKTPLWKNGGNIGKCSMYFDGAGDYVTIPDSSDWAFGSNDFTIEGWIRLDSYPVSRTFSIINKYPYQSWTNRWQMYIHQGDRKLSYYSNNGGDTVTFQSISKFEMEKFYHIALVRKSDNYSIYFNGEYDNSILDGSNPANPSSSILMGSAQGGDSDHGDFHGIMDEFHIYNGKALTPEEIKDVYDRGLQNLKTNITDSLVGSYGFEDCSGSSIRDESGEGNTASLTNGWWQNKKTWFLEGNQKEKGVFFDGDGDYVEVLHDSSFNFGTGPITFSAWIKTDSSGITTKIFDKWSNGMGQLDLYIHNDNNLGGGTWNSDDGIVFDGSIDVTDGEWHHVVMVIDDGGTSGRIYVDGVEDDSVTGAIARDVSSNGNIIIGANNNEAFNFFDGSIDNIRLYSSALSSSEIKDLYTRELANADTSVFDNDANLVSHWTFDDNSTDFQDKSGNNHGTAYGNTTISFVDYYSGVPYSIYDQAGYFPGSDDSVNFAADLSHDLSTAFTLTSWIKMDSAAGLQKTIFSQWPSNCPNTNNNFALEVDENDKLKCFVSKNSCDQYSSNQTLTRERWHYVAATYDNSYVRLYIDGKLDSVHSAPSNLDTSTSGVQIGSWYINGNYNFEFQGGIDEPRIYNRKLSDTEIATEYERGMQNLKSNISDGLVGYLPFDGHFNDEGHNEITTTINDVPYFYGRTGSKEFPNKTYLIGTDQGLDIIDVFEEKLWIRFKKDSSNHIQSDVVCLDAKDGMIYTCMEPNYWGVHVPDFRKDRTWDYVKNTNGYYNVGYLDQRNNKKTWTSPAGLPIMKGNIIYDALPFSLDGSDYFVAGTDEGMSLVNLSSNTAINSEGSPGYNSTKLALAGEDLYWIYTGTNNRDYAESVYNITEVSSGWWYHVGPGGAAYTHDRILTSPGDSSYYPSYISFILGDDNTRYQDLFVTQGTSTAKEGDNTIYVATSNGVSVIQEIQGNESNGTVENYVIGPGVSGQAAIFDGDGDGIYVGSYTPTDDISISAWVKVTDASEQYSIFGSEDSSGYPATLQISGGQVRWVIDHLAATGRRYWATTDANLQDDSWYHIVMTQTGGPTATPVIYVNNISKTISLQTTAGTPSHIADDFYIGERGGSVDFFNGSIDELRIYSKALSSSEVSSLYEKQSVTGSLVSYWDFDDNSTDYQDKAGSRHGTRQGNVYLAYPIIGGDSNNCTSIVVDGNIMYIGTRDGISTINTDTKTLSQYKDNSDGLVGNSITGLVIGSVLYGSEGGAGTLDEYLSVDLGEGNTLTDEDGNEVSTTTYTGTLSIKSGSRKLVSFNTTGAFDIGSVTVDSDNSRTVVSNLDTATGVTTGHSIFIPYLGGGVYVCPNANSLEHVNSTCTNVENFAHEECATPTTKTLGSGDVVTCSISDGLYKVSNLTGSGGGANEARVPEFSDYAIILAIALTLAGIFMMRKNE